MNKDNIVREYLPLVRSIASKYNKLGIPQEDLEQEGMIGLLKASDKYDENKGAKFSTYATFWIRKYILQAVDKEKKITFNSIELNEEITQDKTETTQNPELEILKFSDGMPEAEKLVLKLLYEDQLTLKEIADQLGISRERVRQFKEKALRRMRVKNL